MQSKQRVFIISLLLVVVMAAVGVTRPELFDAGSTFLYDHLIAYAGFGYLIAALIFFVFCFVLAFGKYGHIKLGKDYEKPQYSYFGWFSMLFAAGMGIGLLFWGVAEPLSHYMEPPSFLEPQTGSAAEFAMRSSFFHWGLEPWAIYITMSITIAYFSFRRDMPPLISSCFYPLLGERIYRWPGTLIDIAAVFATLFGIVASLGFGALQITSGLATVFHTPDTFVVTLIIIAVTTICFLSSSLTGLDKGIQILSRINIFLAVLLVIFMFVVGPTTYICEIFTSTVGDYLSSFVSMSLTTNPFQGHDWTRSWTLFYWAWWISWSPFVGLFVASISRGRTIREFVIGAMLVPTLITFIWFSVFGGAAFYLQLHQGIDIASLATASPSSALFLLLQHYPMSNVLIVISIVLLGVFFVTSADSATFVIAMMTSNGNLSPSASKKIFWGLTISVMAVVLLMSGGLGALQKITITAALPFTIIMLFMCRSLLAGLRYGAKYEQTSDRYDATIQENKQSH